MVSILVPVYGVELYIERCARSLFEQTYSDLEYVFVNDLTPDRSIDILLKVMDDYPERKKAVCIIDQEKNRGLAAARNTAVDNASGDFVCMVDSDDLLEKDALEILVHKQIETQADIVSGSRIIHSAGGERLMKERSYRNRQEMILQMMKWSWDHFITGRLVRKSLFTENGLRWNEGLDVAEDRYMMTLLSYYSKGFAKINHVVYHYDNQRVVSVTKGGSAEKVLEKCRQGMDNVLCLKRFFRDKEESYQKECTRCEMYQVLEYLHSAMVVSSEDAFQEATSILDGRSEDDRRLITWKTKGAIGKKLHDYNWMQRHWPIVRFFAYLCKI